MTMGMSEVGMRAFAKKCRLCDHQLSLHQGAEAATPQPAVSFVAPAPAPVPSPRPSVIEQLKDLGALRDAGVLTEEEFAAQKARLLG
ncbi:SHOCT domain-containing protein [Blastococcus sp. PRF04-17]|uniref:SHOCT domain-containing protein n=1 Tax=Blastococcus sp. PRF04-17 TaxID=2933797 RepID=UPI001FF59424|nr:SHOCT domain-containing protein [Blastococcus sp. PRF04-17]UOY01872.1 SHOCT domain-containing protein [Blastococcus sp. PRF04-17]